MAPSSQTEEPEGNPSIAPFHTALNGVNQPVNLVLAYILWGTLGFIAFLCIIVRVFRKVNSNNRLRDLQLSTPEKLAQSARPSWFGSSWFKKHVLYAPLWRSRHAEKFQPLRSSKNAILARMTFGALPTRLHTILISLFMLSNTAYMLILTWDKENKYSLYAEVRGRSGTLAAVNLFPLILFSGRNNPLIRLLSINFDTYNVMHRWIGRTVVFEIMVHAAAWSAVKVVDGGWDGAGEAIITDLFIGSGTVGFAAMVIILILSLPMLRNTFYETFVNVHIILAVVALACAWIHIASAGIPLPQYSWIATAACLWVAERLIRIGRLLVYNWSGKGLTDCIVEPMPGTEACRVTLRLPRHVNIRPGSHAYIRLGAARPWENHPFSIAWAEHQEKNPSGGQVMMMSPMHSTKSQLSVNTYRNSSYRNSSYSSHYGNNASQTHLSVNSYPNSPRSYHDSPPLPSPLSTTGMILEKTTVEYTSTTVSFIVGARTGFTRRLYDSTKPGSGNVRVINTKATFEGPYGGIHSLDSYGHVVLFAGATGITHQLPYVRHLVEGFNMGTVVTKRLVLVWIIRDLQAIEWIRPWLQSILDYPLYREMLDIRIYVTRGPERRELTHDVPCVTIEKGRPDVDQIVREEVAHQTGAMAIQVCGTGGLADSVRKASRDVQGNSMIDFIAESFTW